MRRVHYVVVCLALVAMGCEGRTVVPTAPAPNPTGPPTPAPVPQPPVDRHLGIGEVIQTRITPGDPLCSPEWPHRCRYYGLTAPTDGLLKITMTWQNGVYPLDLGVIDAQGQIWAAAIESGRRRSVTLRVTAGATFVIEIWSESAPGEEFELTSSIN